MMRRREFITLLGGMAACPLAASAQQDARVRRIGVLMAGDENDPLAKTWVSAFTQALAGLGWTDGRNVRMDLRWADDINRMRALAQELVGLQPDIIVTIGIPATAAVQRETQTIPIVFANAGDPVASGIVPRLDRPGGNVTGAAWKPRWEASGLSCCRRSRPGSSGPQSCSIPTLAPHRFICPHLRRRPGRSRSSQSLRPFTATQRSKRPSRPWGASREAALSSRTRSRIARRSYQRRPETRYQRSIRILPMLETAVCSPTDLIR